MAPLAGTPSNPIRVRVFVASPDDVTDERATAMKLLEELPADPLLEGRLALQVVAWDKHGVGVPMLAGMTPQDAILHNLPKPAECDVVVLILWSRVGTPLDPASEAAGGAVGVTGTISEYRNAVQASQRAGGPQVLVYHRTEEPRWAPSDPEAEQKRQQWQAVQAFIAEFRNPDGSFKSGYNEYASTSEFAKKLDGHLRYVLRDLLGLSYLGRGRRRRPSAESPFPGLHAFTRAEEAFFFGRAAETDDLVRRCADRINRFVAVVGASGVGKSSVVAAGLMPRLLAGAVEGSTDWLFLRCSPGEARDPFLSLAFAVQHAIGEGGTFRARELADALAQNPTEIGARIAPILVLARKPPSSE
ncbi:MAG TPA: hypothetical protein VE078_12505, partial [Thermoanaerobaculia bacterium]|nr:hypothetical protein [Thermoanaerobaculia bacterium]